LILFFTITGIILVIALFAIYKNIHDRSRWQHMLETRESELNELQRSEEDLRQELNVMEARLHHAIEDPLTRLLGWTLFEDRVHQGINESARYQFAMAILYVDLNDFKMINEALGYETGDAVLHEVSVRLQSCIRQVDSLSRLSKDVFVVLLTQLGKPETAAVVAQRILESLLQPVVIKDQKLYLTASIGISIYPTDGTDSVTLFRNADEALLLAKDKGTQNYQFYQEKNYANSLRELKLSTGLKRDTFLSECEIYYRPIMNTRDKTIFCMEALLYWRHPELGLIECDELFHHMEKHDKCNTATEWMLRKACQQFLYWRTLGFQPRFLGLTLSMRQLKNIQFVYHISQTLQECDFKPEWLLLEIEENVSQASFESVEKGFNMLKYQNIKLAVNHFGSSLFSIEDLKKFTVNYLKLDASIISDIEENQQSRDLIRSINLLAKSLSMQLILQGVNTEKQKAILTSLECYLIQGTLVGEPGSEPEIIRTYATQKA